MDTPAAISPLAPPLPAPGQTLCRWKNLHGAAFALAAVEAARRLDRPLVLVGADARRVQRIEQQARFFAGDGLPVLHFADWECLPYDQFSPHPDIVSERLSCLARLPALGKGLLCITAANLMQRLPPPEFVLGHSFLLKTGERLDIEALRLRLQSAGYAAVGQVMAPGEYAVRGGLLDVFPMGADKPFRLDLFGETIESIRHFDPETQRSFDAAGHLRLLPAREFPLNEAGIKQFRQAWRNRFAGDPQGFPVYREISRGAPPPGIEFYLPLFFERTATHFDYLDQDSSFLLDAGVTETLPVVEAGISERYELMRHDPARPVLTPAELYLGSAELLERLRDRSRIELAGGDEEGQDLGARIPPDLATQPRSDRPYAALHDFLARYTGRALVVAESPGRHETLAAMLRAGGFSASPCAGWADFLDKPRLGLCMTVSDLDAGLLIEEPALCVITEAQLYGDRVPQRRRRSAAARDPDSIIRSLIDLNVGDPVVHEQHGVGRYRGLTLLPVSGAEHEFLAIEYADGGKLYVPVLALDQVSRYIGADLETAPLHRLGGDAWERARGRARQRAWDAATELLEVQALRASRTGHAYPVPSSYAAFAEAFPFEETPDQAAVIVEVLKDLASERPMDRLVCGDVGFGKTEVALRAAFVAVHDNRQVAVLVPTTLLAQQHYDNFRDRFAGTPVVIELLSRFRSAKEIAATLERIREGTVDIVVGTHRLLQTDIAFKRLGLVIVDEEHRFGVRQKERLKRLRAEVDILTLTATPIPRTLNVALAGMREISIIATPPAGRLSVKTFVREWNDALVREAILREIRRGGQVYFLHNDVRTMEPERERLARLVPEAEIRIAHGQMPERDLERVMSDFYHQRFNVLLCSTIIESGIDIPTANTIVINRADRFGLAQLHQLRGRVGRSHHQAYAWLIVPSSAFLAGDAARRLQVIESLGDLGIGFALASHDLEIRGAGELLGEAQSGLIDEVGFTLYSEYLRQAITTLSRGRDFTEVEAPAPAAEIDLRAPALLPPDYVSDVHLRLSLYKRISGVTDADALAELRSEVRDRFGPLPEPARVLFELAGVKLDAGGRGIRKIDLGPKGGRVVFGDKPDLDPQALIRLLQAQPRVYRMENPTTLRVTMDLPDVEARLDALRALLSRLVKGEG